MKERPILFTTGNIQAILEDRKTQTRRIIKKQPHGAGKWIMQGISWLFPIVNPYVNIKCPYGQPGDVLYVKETWRSALHSFPIGPKWDYKATTEEDGVPLDEPWRPSIYMPKEACRIRLQVEEVNVERLRDISNEDCKAEGLTAPMITDHSQGGWYVAYKALWESINGKGSWNKNPWVWVIKFKRI